MSDITVNIKGPSELKLEITISPEKTVLELKQAIAEKSDVEADRQRLIFSGRVLKDEEALSVYKIATSHTIHMVKGAARNAAASTPQTLPTMQSGQAANDPLTLLNSHRGFGALAAAGNPFAQAGLNPNDPNMMQTMMNSPEFLQQMAAMMSNPEVIDQMIASDPRLQAMGPRAREMFNNPQFREMLSNPQRLQQMIAQMTGGPDAGFGGLGGGMFGGGAGGGGFPAPGQPGVPNAAAPPPQNTAAGGQLFGGPNQNAGAFNPALLQGLFGGGGAGNMFGAPGAGGAPVAPFGGDPWGTGGWAAPAAPTPPADSRSPEERYETQLQQLNGMGFTNATQNVRALLATSGNVHAAIEYILSGGGL